MLDAYIIDRIRREKERARQRDHRIPLHIEPPGRDRGERGDPERSPGERPDDGERGTVIIDFQV